MTEDGKTVFEETATAFSHIHQTEARIAELNKELETRTDYNSEEYYKIMRSSLL